jgi:hypothetical protein
MAEPITLTLLAAAWLVSKFLPSSASSEGGDATDDSGDASADPGEAVQPSDWTGDIAQASSSSDPEGWQEFLLRWIQRESGGNPCSVGSAAQLQRDGWAREAGIGQVYFESARAASYGALSSQLHPADACSLQEQTRPLTSDERAIQVSTLVEMATDYYHRASSKLSSLGLDWSNEDTLALTKSYHALPVIPTSWLAIAHEDGNADSWDAFASWVSGLSHDEAVTVDQRAGYAAGHGAAPYYPLDRLMSNATWTGKGQ